jgi:hypothetical protein
MQGLCTIMHTSILCRFSSSMQRPRTPTQVYTSFYDTRLLLVVPTAEDNFMHVPCSFYADLCELCNLDIYLCSSCQSRCTWPHFASANASAAALGTRAAAAVGARRLGGFNGTGRQQPESVLVRDQGILTEPSTLPASFGAIPSMAFQVTTESDRDRPGKRL